MCQKLNAPFISKITKINLKSMCITEVNPLVKFWGKLWYIIDFLSCAKFLFHFSLLFSLSLRGGKRDFQVYKTFYFIFFFLRLQ